MHIPGAHGAPYAYTCSRLSQRSIKELATNKDDNAILVALAENEADLSQLEHDSRDGGVRATSGTVADVEQLQGLGVFAADIREELIGKILKPLIELEELAGDPDAISSLTRYCKWADSLEEQFACAEYLVEEGRAFFDTKNLERLKSIPLPEDSARLVRSLHWDSNKAAKNR